MSASFGRLAIADAPKYLTFQDPNFRAGGGGHWMSVGPNLPSWAAPIQQQSGGIHAGAVFGDVMPMNEANSFGAATAQRPKYREVPGRGGYVYRQYESGMIQILAGPALVGKVVTSTSDPRRWSAITAEIGPYTRTRRKVDPAIVASIAQAVASLSASTVSVLRPAPPPEPAPTEMDVMAESPGLPGWVIPVGLGGAALVLLIALRSRK